ncbi:transposase [Sphingomonas aestuarii]
MQHTPKRSWDDPPAALETIAAFDLHFPTDDSCLEQLFQTRFGTGFDCPRCGRSTNWHRIKAERAYSCQWCGNHLHPTAGTPLQSSRIPLRLWFYAIRQSERVSSKMLVRQIVAAFGVAPVTAQRIVRRVQDASIDWTEIILSSQRQGRSKGYKKRQCNGLSSFAK